jgi:hypothetical protein
VIQETQGGWRIQHSEARPAESLSDRTDCTGSRGKRNIEASAFTQASTSNTILALRMRYPFAWEARHTAS